MAYKIDFVGVVCLHQQPDGTELALLPDGTSSEPRHIARLVVDKPANVLEGADTWGERTDHEVQGGVFNLPPGSISIQGTDTRGELNAAALSQLPELPVLAQGFEVDPSTHRVWTSIPVRQGTLEVCRWPGSADNGKASLITQLTVDHAGEFRIDVRDRRDPDRPIFLRLAAGTNVVIVNDSTLPTSRNPHFHIYNLLDRDARPLLSEDPPRTPAGIGALTTFHPFYDSGISGEDQCPNTQSRS